MSSLSKDSKMVEMETEKKKNSFAIRDMFKFTTKQDVVYMCIGSVGAAITGATFPLFNVVFGKILDELNDDGSNFQEGVNKVAIIFAIFAGVDFFSGFVQVSAFPYAVCLCYVDLFLFAYSRCIFGVLLVNGKPRHSAKSL